MQKINLKLVESISLKGLTGFFAAVLIFFISNVSIEWWNWEDGAFRFMIYAFIMFMLMIAGIDRPGIINFAQKVFQIITNNKLSTEERLSLVRVAMIELVGFFADLSQQASAEDKLEEIKKL